jgi:hypothetical protein
VDGGDEANLKFSCFPAVAMRDIVIIDRSHSLKFSFDFSQNHKSPLNWASTVSPFPIIKIRTSFGQRQKQNIDRVLTLEHYTCNNVFVSHEVIINLSPFPFILLGCSLYLVEVKAPITPNEPKTTCQHKPTALALSSSEHAISSPKRGCDLPRPTLPSKIPTLTQLSCV